MRGTRKRAEQNRWPQTSGRGNGWSSGTRSFEALSEEREACAALTEETAARYPGDPSDLKALAASVAAPIRNRAA